MYARGITNSTDFLLSVYDVLIHTYDVDVYNKLYETAISNVMRTAKRNQAIWNMQDIRGINTSIHSLQSVQNVLINIMPKYEYSGNLVHLNYKSENNARHNRNIMGNIFLIAGTSLLDNQQRSLEIGTFNDYPL